MKTVLLTVCMLFTSLAFAENSGYLALRGEVVEKEKMGPRQAIAIQNFELVTYTASLPEEGVKLFFLMRKEQISLYTHQASKVQVSNCKDAIIILGVGEGNVIPSVEERYVYPSIESFTCITK